MLPNIDLHTLMQQVLFCEHGFIRWYGAGYYFSLLASSGLTQ